MSRHSASSSSLKPSIRRLLILVTLIACLVIALSPIAVRAQGPPCEGNNCGRGPPPPSGCRDGSCGGPPQDGSGPSSSGSSGSSGSSDSSDSTDSSDSSGSSGSSNGQPSEQSSSQSENASTDTSTQTSNGGKSNGTSNNNASNGTSNESSDNTNFNSTTNDSTGLNGTNGDDSLLGGPGISYAVAGGESSSLDKGFTITVVIILVIIGFGIIAAVGIWWYRKRQIKHDWKRLTTYHEQQHRNSMFGAPVSSQGTAGPASMRSVGTRSAGMSPAVPSQSPRVVEEARGYHITEELERPSTESGQSAAVGSTSHLAEPVTSTSLASQSQAELEGPSTTSLEGGTTLYTIDPSTSSVDISAEEGIEQRSGQPRED